MISQNLKNLISPAFYEVHNAVKNNTYTHYWLKGGRGSCKSSFASVEIVLGMMNDKDANAVCIRKVASSIKDSIFEQIKWAINAMRVEHLWQIKATPEIIYQPTGQRILFRGADDVSKIKSTKVSKGYVKYIWFEECAEFKGLEEILSVNQSLMRGGEVFSVFYTYNPPKLINHWINRLEKEKREDKLVHTSNYLSTPKSWLGVQFFREAEILKKSNMQLFLHQYMGEATGCEGLILTDYEVKDFDRTFDFCFIGQDFGYNHKNAILLLGFTDNELYVIKEHYVSGLDTSEIIREVDGMFDKRLVMWCDSAEPDRIKMWQKAGYRAAPVSKEPNCIHSQIDFLLSQKIIIHPSCKGTIAEIESWSWLKDKATDEYTDTPAPLNDDAMAALRYGIEYVRKVKGGN